MMVLLGLALTTLLTLAVYDKSLRTYFGEFIKNSVHAGFTTSM